MMEIVANNIVANQPPSGDQLQHHHSCQNIGLKKIMLQRNFLLKNKFKF